MYSYVPLGSTDASRGSINMHTTRTQNYTYACAPKTMYLCDKSGQDWEENVYGRLPIPVLKEINDNFTQWRELTLNCQEAQLSSPKVYWYTGEGTWLFLVWFTMTEHSWNRQAMCNSTRRTRNKQDHLWNCDCELTRICEQNKDKYMCSSIGFSIFDDHKSWPRGDLYEHYTSL